MPGRRDGHRGTQRHGRIVPDRRTLPHVQDAGLRGVVGRRQRRSRADDPGRQAGRGLSLFQDHAGHAGIRAAPTASAAPR